MRTILMILIVLIGGAGSATAEPLARSALVIGNQIYPHWSPLRTSRHDAESMAEILRSLGYQTEVVLDGTRDQMLHAVERLTQRLSMPHDSVVIFYAGHGIQIEGINYLVPVDLPEQLAPNPADSLVELSTFLSPLRSPSTDVIKIVFIDACRNNPLRDRLGTQPGLAEPSAKPPNSLIGYATDLGRAAEDGEWQHSPYTQALLQDLARVGQELDETMIRVRNSVRAMTDKTQTPWIFKSTARSFYFRDPVIGTLQILDVDDSAVVTVNGAEVASSSGRRTSEVRLAAGRNTLSVMVYNQKSYTGNNPYWGCPEGWRYALSFAFPEHTPLSSVIPQSASCGFTADARAVRLQGAEQSPPRDGTRHGSLFVAGKAVLDVDEFTGAVSLVSTDCLNPPPSAVPWCR